jgi:hypothetical protein
MQTKFASSLLLITAIAATGCAADSSVDNNDPGAPEVVSSTADELASAVAINGTFRIDQFWGSNYDDSSPIYKKYTSGESVAIKIGLDGSGTLTGMQSCTPEIGAGGTAANAAGPKAWNRMAGAFGVISALLDLGKTFQCNGSASLGTMRSARKSDPSFGIFGWDKRLNDNLGLRSQPDAKYGSATCKSLRSVQYLRFGYNDEATGCMGYRDGVANQLTMVIQRTGSIYLQLIYLTRK